MMGRTERAILYGVISCIVILACGIGLSLLVAVSGGYHFGTPDFASYMKVGVFLGALIGLIVGGNVAIVVGSKS